MIRMENTMYLSTVAASLVLLSSVTPLVADDGALPRSEHPRPDAMRENWLCLNGQWQFEIDADANGLERGLASGKDLASSIIVPFCPESQLSGLGHTDFMKNVWYRRMFTLPESMQGQRVLLHFGAVDYKAWVWVNGREVGGHTGGSAAFACEITSALKPGENEVVVRVFDDTASGLQPTGKQTHSVSEGCVYTRTTGIWQSVWLEAAGQSYVKEFSVVPDPEHARVLIEATVDGPLEGLQLAVHVLADGKLVGQESGLAGSGAPLVLNLSEKHLWSPSSPFLYDLELVLERDGKPVDTVRSYFGLRSVSIDGRSVLINGQRVFQRLILDQGFYPDGIWTAPSDEALKRDIELSMAAGFNGARLHQKVFEPRFLYWADKLGYLVWGEFPNWGYNYEPKGYAPYTSEWAEIVRRDRNHPSIIGWCPFNETDWVSTELQQVIWNLTQAIDPTRPVLETSGWRHSLLEPQLCDFHDYEQDPTVLKNRWMDYFDISALRLPEQYHNAGATALVPDRGCPFMLSEFGGTRWAEEQSSGQAWGYGQAPSDMEEFYRRYEGLVNALLDNPNMFGFCYTQLTDVEQERNGLYYYDRRPKFDAGRLHAITSREAAYEKTGPITASRENGGAPWNVLVGASPDKALARPYRYTFDAPAAEWLNDGFDDGKWASGMAPFGNELPGVRTPWTSADIYLRQQFPFDSGEPSQMALVIFYDEDTEIYLNGHRIFEIRGFVNSYTMLDVTQAAKPWIKQGLNTLAVHTRQTGGGQYIDLALLYR